MTSFENMREQYSQGSLLEGNTPSNPFTLFQSWMVEAINNEQPEPNAMVLSTTGMDGIPQARTVLLKETNERGFIFYTNYESDKAKEIEFNPNVSLLFFWLQAERQIRIVGKAKRLSEAKNADYFAKRPRGSQLGAWTSPQSQVIKSRDFLMEKYQEVLKNIDTKKVIEKPPFWGGYVVEPTTFEFWQGRENRLHDRIKYNLIDSEWCKVRLAP